MKHENPIRGYLSCPVCTSTSTVHQVGEGRLIATGEPPKNSRSIGLMYYRCPECGNSSISKKVTEFIQGCFVTDVTELKPKVTEKTPVTEPVLIAELTENLTEQAAELTEVVTEKTTELVESDEASNDAASNCKVTEENTDDQGFPLGRLFLALFSVIFLVWAVRRLLVKPKPVTEEMPGGEHGHTQ